MVGVMVSVITVAGVAARAPVAISISRARRSIVRRRAIAPLAGPPRRTPMINNLGLFPW